ncbi:MAG: RNA polymerase sigma-70 factor [Bacteroidales bacterium]|nr:RNA polymerase sigma-70 factor [Bacteroidales bacterium]
MISVTKTIVNKFKAGDAAAFDAIYDMYSQKLYNFAFGLLKDHDNAGEIVQEVFVTLWEKRDQLNVALNFENYIFTITHNSIRKFFRKKSMENKVKDFLLKNSPEVTENADASIVYNELFELANKTIDKLPPKRKTIYKLSRLEGMTIKEIANRLDISTRTAENQLAKALKYLKEELQNLSLLSLLFYYLFLG